MPLRRQGVSRWKSWKWGQMSAIVEPIFAVIGATVVMQVLPILPYALFLSRIMIFIVVEEVIPESQSGGHTDLSNNGINIWIYSDDGIRCIFRLNPLLFTIFNK